MEPNNLLANAKLVGQKRLLGPECLALGPDGLLYTGTKNGQIVRVDPEKDTVEMVVQIGDGSPEFCGKRFSIISGEKVKLVRLRHIICFIHIT